MIRTLFTQLDRRDTYGLHTFNRQNNRRISSAFIYGGICAFALRLFRGAWKRRGDADRRAVRLCQGAGRVRRRLCDCGNTFDFYTANKFCGYPRRQQTQAEERKMNILEIKDLCLWYDTVQALKNVNIGIPEKSITALSGLRLESRFSDAQPHELFYPGVRIS
jgi:hypothetical protein